MSSIETLLGTGFVFSLVGSVIGGLAALMPGMHPNAFATIAISLSPSAGLSDVSIVALSSLLIGLMMAHSICEIIPTAMLGASSEDNVVVLLPSQRLFQAGEHALLLRSVLFGVCGALVVFIILIVPARLMMGDPVLLYQSIRNSLGLILIAICAVSIWRSRHSGLSLCVIEFLAAGTFGLFVLTFEAPGTISSGLFGGYWPTDPSVFLLPAFSGLFAMPSLLQFSDTVVQRKSNRLARNRKVKPLLPIARSILPSMLVGWLPGMTNAYATSLTSARRHAVDDVASNSSDYLVTYIATGVGGALQSLIALFTIQRARNGTMEAIGGLMGSDQIGWSDILSPQPLLIALIVSAIVSSLAGCLLCKVLGRRLFAMNDAARLHRFRLLVICFISSLVLVSTGPIGGLVFLTATCIGLSFLVHGVPRIHLIGFLLMPVIFYFFFL